MDSDFEDKRRQEVIEYTKQKYGEQSVCQILTLGNMMARNILRNAGKAMSMNAALIDKVAKMIPLEVGMTLEKALGINSQLKDLYNKDVGVQHLIDIALKLEGLPKSTGRHAAGVLITDEKGVTNHVPVLLSKKGDVVTQYSKDILESIGLLKMDFLGLKTMGVIQGAIDNIERNHGTRINLTELYTIPDPKPFELMANGNTDAIFQIESPGMTDFFKKLKPTCLGDVTLGISMYRPGPMDLIPQLLKNKQDMDNIVYEIPDMEPILRPTYGVFCYQEQLMQIVVKIGGYTRADSDGFRKVVAKKKENLIPLHRKWFIDGRNEVDVDEEGREVHYSNAIPGGVELGYSRESLNKIFDEMEEFAKYSFCKSHGAVYATIAYVTAWLAYYYPAEYFASVLDYAAAVGDSPKMTRYINHCRSINLEVSEIDVNNSGTTFNPISRNKIVYPLIAKGTKVTAVEKIIQRRPSGGYKDIYEFLTLNFQTCDKATFNALANVKAFSCFGYTCSSLSAGATDIFSKLISSSNKKKFEKLSRKELEQIIREKLDEYIPDLREFSDEISLRLEKEYLKHYLSGNPLDHYVNEIRECKKDEQSSHKYTYLENFEYSVDEDTGAIIPVGNIYDGQQIKVLASINELRLLTTKKKQQMCRLEILDTTGTAPVIVFPQAFETYRGIIKEDMIYEVHGTVQVSDDEAPQIILDELFIVSSSGSSEKCTFYVSTKKQASEICIILSGMTSRPGDAIPTYFNVGSIRQLIPEKFWIKRSVLGKLDTRKYYYQITM